MFCNALSRRTRAVVCGKAPSYPSHPADGSHTVRPRPFLRVPGRFFPRLPVLVTRRRPGATHECGAGGCFFSVVESSRFAFTGRRQLVWSCEPHLFLSPGALKMVTLEGVPDSQKSVIWTRARIRLMYDFLRYPFCWASFIFSSEACIIVTSFIFNVQRTERLLGVPRVSEARGVL